MRISTLFILIFITSIVFGQDLKTPFEKSKNTTATYEECIKFYEKLDAEYDELKLIEIGETDSGEPLHLVILDTDQDFEPEATKAKEKLILLVNNGIHPGEPEGIDASMILLRNYLENEEKLELLDKIVLAFIPIYNIGGALNRSSHSRANQNGPQSYGFRGNAKNLDLNRDFVKCDSKNAEAMSRLFGKWKPDIFVDNHTSNGADYPYTMTLLATQKDKLTLPISDYMNQTLIPNMYKEMKRRKWEMCPYVYARTTPDEGILGFMDSPRYSTGFSTLHETIGFTVETHMLKPFEDRMWSTYHFMDILIREAAKDYSTIRSARERTFLYSKNRNEFVLNWELDTSKVDKFLFKGYEAKYKPSEVTGLDRLYYDRNSMWEKEIDFFNTYKPSVTVEKPHAYIIPQAYSKVIERLKWNGVKMSKLEKNKTLEAEFYYIKNYDSRKTPYEGHYLHSKVEVEKKMMNWNFRKGDYVVYTNQRSNRLIVELLEPQGMDSYFAWNFFDGILQQKEYFSPYVFEDVAAELLENDEQLRIDFEKKIEEDKEFAKSSWAQLYFIYKRSPYYEPTHNLYPVARVLTIVKF